MKTYLVTDEYGVSQMSDTPPGAVSGDLLGIDVKEAWRRFVRQIGGRELFASADAAMHARKQRDWLAELVREGIVQEEIPGRGRRPSQFSRDETFIIGCLGALTRYGQSRQTLRVAAAVLRHELKRTTKERRMEEAAAMN